MSCESCFFTNRSGLHLHYLHWGPRDAAPLLLLHGLRAYAQTWESLVAALDGQFCCYALDQRGRGLSDWAQSDSYRTESYVSDLEDLVEHLQLQRFTLVGHSLGGTNALEYARINPGRLQALVIEDIGPGSSISGEGAARIRREMAMTPLVFASWEEAGDFWRRSRPGLSEEGVVSRLAHSMQQTDAGIQWRHDQQGIAVARLSITPTDLWPAVKSLDCPTLFIRGGRSDFLPTATLAALPEHNARISTVEIADASHYVHDDQSERFNQTVVDFLQGLDLLTQQPMGNQA